MIKIGLILTAAFILLSGMAALVSFIIFLIQDPWIEWLVRFAVSFSLLVFLYHWALPQLTKAQLRQTKPREAQS